MGPKSELATALDELYNDTLSYVSYHVNMDTADEASKKLLENEAPEPPEYFILYRKLKMWGGDGIRFLWDGGYMDQPYIATQAIEMCMSAERDYKALVKVTNEQRLQEQSKKMGNQSQ